MYTRYLVYTYIIYYSIFARGYVTVSASAITHNIVLSSTSQRPSDPLHNEFLIRTDLPYYIRVGM